MQETWEPHRWGSQRTFGPEIHFWVSCQGRHWLTASNFSSSPSWSCKADRADAVWSQLPKSWSSQILHAHAKARHSNLLCFSCLSWAFPTDHSQTLLSAFCCDPLLPALHSHRAPHSSINMQHWKKPGSMKRGIQGINTWHCLLQWLCSRQHTASEPKLGNLYSDSNKKELMYLLLRVNFPPLLSHPSCCSTRHLHTISPFRILLSFPCSTHKQELTQATALPVPN